MKTLGLRLGLKLPQGPAGNIKTWGGGADGGVWGELQKTFLSHAGLVVGCHTVGPRMTTVPALPREARC